jgi:hypothetical protein
MIIEATRKPVVTIERDGSRVIDYGGRIRIPRGITRDYTAGTTTEYITEEQAKYVLSVGEGSNVRYLYVPTLIAALYHANNTANLLLEGSCATSKLR